MKPTALIFAAIATLTLSAQTSPTGAETAAFNTIEVTSAYISAQPAYIDNGPPNSVTIGFRNTGDVAAKELVFLIDGGSGLPCTIDDQGNFTKGDYTHTFYNVGDIYGAKVTLVDVVYADGNEWIAPAPPSTHRALPW
jgi:hypothetical protein